MPIYIYIYIFTISYASILAQGSFEVVDSTAQLQYAIVIDTYLARNLNKLVVIQLSGLDHNVFDGVVTPNTWRQVTSALCENKFTRAFPLR